MTNILGNAKSGSDWTANELFSYNIKIVEQYSFPDFFRAANLPPVSENVRSFVETLDRATARQEDDEDTYKLLHYLNLVHDPQGWARSCRR